MADKIYKALFIKRDTHTQIMVEAKQQGMTADELMAELLRLHKENEKRSN